ncbi:MAG: hypothetical protein RML56_02720 [Burkholderiales bacterium]|nr:hypothetical protein [Burkholderiales bacterium]
MLSGERSYARALAWCALANGLDLGEYLVRRGVCGRCPRYDPEGRYLAADREAGPYAGHVPRYCRRF